MRSSTYSSGSSFSSRKAQVAAGAAVAVALVFGVQPAVADVFQDVINPGDPTFNQELGINNSGTIAGYFGSGAAGHPNQGYTTTPSYTSFTSENFPASVQTQVTGINDSGTTVGFWSNTNLGPPMDSNFAFVDVGGVFTTADDPNVATTGTITDQLLGVNNSNVAVGFYVDASGNTYGYLYNINTGTFSAPISDPSGMPGTTTAAAINNSGEIAGFYTNATTGLVDGFIDNGGTFSTIAVPGAMSTTLLGINDNGLAVGVDTYSSGLMFGLVCSISTLTCVQESDPNGTGTTTFNGINDLDQIVGFYTNGAGNVIGLVTTVPEPSTMTLLLSGLAGLATVRFRRRRAT